MSITELGIKHCFDEIGEKIKQLRDLPNTEEQDIETYLLHVNELHSHWQDFEKLIESRISLEEIIQSATSSYNEETQSYDEELRKHAVDAINEEIERLRILINNLLRIHQQTI